jgi:hypothetical protein
VAGRWPELLLHVTMSWHELRVRACLNRSWSYECLNRHRCSTRIFPPLSTLLETLKEPLIPHIDYRDRTTMADRYSFSLTTFSPR